MRYGFVTLFIFLLSGWQNPVPAQQLIIKNYTVNDGLISNAIRRVFQDSKGFLWIATLEGLSKYDGHTFTGYNNANGLQHNMVNDFYEAKNGLVYIALNNGSINGIAENKVSYTTPVAGAVVNRFITTPWQQVIATTDGKGLQLLKDGKLVIPGQLYPTSTFTDIAILNDTSFIATGDNFIRLFNKNFELIAEVNEGPYKYPEIKIYQDSKKRIWAGTTTGLKLIAGFPQKNKPILFEPLPAAFNVAALQKNIINAIVETADGTLWFGTKAGLVKINPDGSHKLITVNDGLSSNIITDIFQDREKNIWIGTAVGLSKMVTKSGITLYPLDNGVWTNDNLYLLFPFKENNFLVSTYNGVQVFDKVTGRFTPVINRGAEMYFNVVKNAAIPMMVGFYNMATFDTVTFRYDKKLAALPNNVSRVISDKDGNFFSANLTSLYFTAGKKTIKILDYRISSLLIDRLGNLWAGTWGNGLFCIKYFYTNDSLKIIENKNYLPGENIRWLYQDEKENIWAGSRYQGLYRMVKNKNDDFTISNFNQASGLTSNWVKEIMEDGKGNYWIASYNGLDKLIPRDTGYRVFNFSRVHNFFTSIIGMQISKDHSLWIATGEGLAHITDGEMEKTPPLPVYITKVFSPDSTYAPNTVNTYFSHKQNQLQFEFSSPGFINEKQILYSYRLSGSADTSFTTGTNQHTVSYASLQPGSYTFQVRALGWDGNWGSPASFAFIIKPAYWQTWWFITACIVITACIIYLFIKKRIQLIRHEAEMKQKIAATEMMALRAQMNPLFIFNCLNSIDNLIQMEEKEKATVYLSKFARLIRSILENSKSNIVPCWKDMETLQLYLELEALRFDNKFLYQVNISNEIINGDYKVPPLVIQPFVENAIHHGLLNKIEADKKLLVNVSVINNQLHYSIEDNGVGRAKAAAYKQLNKPAYQSLGMQITSERINLFNQQNNGAVKITDLYDELGNPTGTKVEVNLINQP